MKKFCFNIFPLRTSIFDTSVVVHLELRISLQIFKKMRNGADRILGPEEDDSQKNPKSKISWHFPFK